MARVRFVVLTLLLAMSFGCISAVVLDGESGTITTTTYGYTALSLCSASLYGPPAAATNNSIGTPSSGLPVPTSTMPLDLQICENAIASEVWGQPFQKAVDAALNEQLLEFYEAARAADATNNLALQEFAVQRFNLILGISDYRLFSRASIKAYSQYGTAAPNAVAFASVGCPPGTFAATPYDTTLTGRTAAHLWKLSDGSPYDSVFAPTTLFAQCARPCPTGCLSCTSFFHDGAWKSLGQSSVCTACMPGWSSDSASVKTYPSSTLLMSDGSTPYSDTVVQCACQGCIDPTTGYCVATTNGACSSQTSPDTSPADPSNLRRRLLDAVAQSGHIEVTDDGETFDYGEARRRNLAGCTPSATAIVAAYVCDLDVLMNNIVATSACNPTPVPPLAGCTQNLITAGITDLYLQSLQFVDHTATSQGVLLDAQDCRAAYQAVRYVQHLNGLVLQGIRVHAVIGSQGSYEDLDNTPPFSGPPSILDAANAQTLVKAAWLDFVNYRQPYGVPDSTSTPLPMLWRRGKSPIAAQQAQVLTGVGGPGFTAWAGVTIAYEYASTSTGAWTVVHALRLNTIARGLALANPNLIITLSPTPLQMAPYSQTGYQGIDSTVFDYLLPKIYMTGLVQMNAGPCPGAISGTATSSCNLDSVVLPDLQANFSPPNTYGNTGASGACPLQVWLKGFQSSGGTTWLPEQILLGVRATTGVDPTTAAYSATLDPANAGVEYEGMIGWEQAVWAVKSAGARGVCIDSLEAYSLNANGIIQSPTTYQCQWAKKFAAAMPGAGISQTVTAGYCAHWTLQLTQAQGCTGTCATGTGVAGANTVYDNVCRPAQLAQSPGRPDVVATGIWMCQTTTLPNPTYAPYPSTRNTLLPWETAPGDPTLSTVGRIMSSANLTCTLQRAFSSLYNTTRAAFQPCGKGRLADIISRQAQRAQTPETEDEVKLPATDGEASWRYIWNASAIAALELLMPGQAKAFPQLYRDTLTAAYGAAKAGDIYDTLIPIPLGTWNPANQAASGATIHFNWGPDAAYSIDVDSATLEGTDLGPQVANSLLTRTSYASDGSRAMPRQPLLFAERIATPRASWQQQIVKNATVTILDTGRITVTPSPTTTSSKMSDLQIVFATQFSPQINIKDQLISSDPYQTAIMFEIGLDLAKLEDNLYTDTTGATPIPHSTPSKIDDRCTMSRALASVLFCSVIRGWYPTINAALGNNFCQGVAVPWTDYKNFVNYFGQTSTVHGYQNFAGFVIASDSTDEGLLFADLVRCVPEMAFARFWTDQGDNPAMDIATPIMKSIGYQALSTGQYSQFAPNFLFAAWAPTQLITSNGWPTTAYPLLSTIGVVANAQGDWGRVWRALYELDTVFAPVNYVNDIVYLLGGDVLATPTGTPSVSSPLTYQALTPMGWAEAYAYSQAVQVTRIYSEGSFPDNRTAADTMATVTSPLHFWQQGSALSTVWTRLSYNGQPSVEELLKTVATTVPQPIYIYSTSSEQGTYPPIAIDYFLWADGRKVSLNYNLDGFVGAASARYLLAVVAGFQLSINGTFAANTIRAPQKQSYRGYSGALLGYDCVAQLRVLVAAGTTNYGQGALGYEDSVFVRPLLTTNSSRNGPALIRGDFFFAASDRIDLVSASYLVRGAASLKQVPLHTALAPTSLQLATTNTLSSGVVNLMFTKANYYVGAPRTMQSCTINHWNQDMSAGLVPNYVAVYIPHEIFCLQYLAPITASSMLPAQNRLCATSGAQFYYVNMRGRPYASNSSNPAQLETSPPLYRGYFDPPFPDTSFGLSVGLPTYCSARAVVGVRGWPNGSIAINCSQPAVGAMPVVLETQQFKGACVSATVLNGTFATPPLPWALILPAVIAGYRQHAPSNSDTSPWRRTLPLTTPTGGSILIEPNVGTASAQPTYISLPFNSPYGDLPWLAQPWNYTKPLGFKGVYRNGIAAGICGEATMLPPLCNLCTPGRAPSYTASGVITSCSASRCGGSCIACDPFGSGAQSSLGTGDLPNLAPECTTCDAGFQTTYDASWATFTTSWSVPYMQSCMSVGRARLTAMQAPLPNLPVNAPWYWKAEMVARGYLTLDRVSTLTSASQWNPSKRESVGAILAGDIRPLHTVVLTSTYTVQHILQPSSTALNADQVASTIAAQLIQLICNSTSTGKILTGYRIPSTNAPICSAAAAPAWADYVTTALTVIMNLGPSDLATSCSLNADTTMSIDEVLSYMAMPYFVINCIYYVNPPLATPDATIIANVIAVAYALMPFTTLTSGAIVPVNSPTLHTWRVPSGFATSWIWPDLLTTVRLNTALASQDIPLTTMLNNVRYPSASATTWHGMTGPVFIERATLSVYADKKCAFNASTIQQVNAQTATVTTSWDNSPTSLTDPSVGPAAIATLTFYANNVAHVRAWQQGCQMLQLTGMGNQAVLISAAAASTPDGYPAGQAYSLSNQDPNPGPRARILTGSDVTPQITLGVQYDLITDTVVIPSTGKPAAGAWVITVRISADHLATMCTSSGTDTVTYTCNLGVRQVANLEDIAAGPIPIVLTVTVQTGAVGLITGSIGTAPSTSLDPSTTAASRSVIGAGVTSTAYLTYTNFALDGRPISSGTVILQTTHSLTFIVSPVVPVLPNTVQLTLIGQAQLVDGHNNTINLNTCPSSGQLTSASGSLSVCLTIIVSQLSVLDLSSNLHVQALITQTTLTPPTRLRGLAPAATTTTASTLAVNTVVLNMPQGRGRLVGPIVAAYICSHYAYLYPDPNPSNPRRAKITAADLLAQGINVLLIGFVTPQVVNGKAYFNNTEGFIECPAMMQQPAYGSWWGDFLTSAYNAGIRIYASIGGANTVAPPVGWNQVPTLGWAAAFQDLKSRVPFPLDGLDVDIEMGGLYKNTNSDAAQLFANRLGSELQGFGYSVIAAPMSSQFAPFGYYGWQVLDPTLVDAVFVQIYQGGCAAGGTETCPCPGAHVLYSKNPSSCSVSNADAWASSCGVIDLFKSITTNHNRTWPAQQLIIGFKSWCGTDKEMGPCGPADMGVLGLNEILAWLNVLPVAGVGTWNLEQYMTPGMFDQYGNPINARCNWLRGVADYLKITSTPGTPTTNASCLIYTAPQSAKCQTQMNSTRAPSMAGKTSTTAYPSLTSNTALVDSSGMNVAPQTTQSTVTPSTGGGSTTTPTPTLQRGTPLPSKIIAAELDSDTKTAAQLLAQGINYVTVPGIYLVVSQSLPSFTTTQALPGALTTAAALSLTGSVHVSVALDSLPALASLSPTGFSQLPQAFAQLQAATNVVFSGLTIRWGDATTTMGVQFVTSLRSAGIVVVLEPTSIAPGIVANWAQPLSSIAGLFDMLVLPWDDTSVQPGTTIPCSGTAAMSTTSCSAGGQCGASQIVAATNWPANNIAVRINSQCYAASCTTTQQVGIFGIDDVGQILQSTGVRGIKLNSIRGYYNTGLASQPASVGCAYLPTLATGLGLKTGVAAADPSTTAGYCFYFSSTASYPTCTQPAAYAMYPPAPFGHAAASSGNSNTGGQNTGGSSLANNQGQNSSSSQSSDSSKPAWVMPVIVVAAVIVILLLIYCINKCIDNHRLSHYRVKYMKMYSGREPTVVDRRPFYQRWFCAYCYRIVPERIQRTNNNYDQVQLALHDPSPEKMTGSTSALKSVTSGLRSPVDGHVMAAAKGSSSAVKRDDNGTIMRLPTLSKKGKQ